MTTPDFSLLAEFFTSRADWLAVAVIPAMNGSEGHDIALRLDGCYVDPYIHDEIAAVFAARLERALSVAQIIKPLPERTIPTLPTVVRCTSCNRPLRADASRDRQLGPVCARWLARRQHDYPHQPEDTA